MAKNIAHWSYIFFSLVTVTHKKIECLELGFFPVVLLIGDLGDIC